MAEADRDRFAFALRISRLAGSPSLSPLKRQIKAGVLSLEDLKSLEFKFGPPIADVVSYCLMPNHFHLEIKERDYAGASKLLQRLTNSYTKYFNKRHQRVGRLFEASYKSVRVETEEQLIHLSRYIHTNPSNSSKPNLTPKELRTYPWSSLLDYLGKRCQPFCEPIDVMSYFSSPTDYWNFIRAGIGKEEAVLPPSHFLDDGE